MKNKMSVIALLFVMTMPINTRPPKRKPTKNEFYAQEYRDELASLRAEKKNLESILPQTPQIKARIRTIERQIIINQTALAELGYVDTGIRFGERNYDEDRGFDINYE